jgi:hypothetical protein
VLIDCETNIEERAEIKYEFIHLRNKCHGGHHDFLMKCSPLHHEFLPNLHIVFISTAVRSEAPE